MDGNRALYIGAGLDVKPVKIFKNTSVFIYVDSLPQSEYGVHASPGSYDYTFVDALIRKLRCIGFYLHGDDVDMMIQRAPRCKPQTPEIPSPDTEPFMARFVSECGKRMLYYHFNTCFPLKCPVSLTQQIQSVDTLIVVGFNPDKCILDMMKTPVHLLFFKGSLYSKNDHPDHKDGVINYLHDKGFKGLVAECNMYRKEYVAEFCMSMDDVVKI